MNTCTIGVLGGGQLGRMLALAGAPLGLRFRFLDPSPDAPARHVGELCVGAFDDASALRRFADGLDAITYEFENVPVASARALADRAPLFPPPDALATAQDRLLEKTLFNRLGVPTARFAPVAGEADLRTAIGAVGLPAVMKTRRMGYDGKGQVVIRSEHDAMAAWKALSGAPSILEEFVAFRRELSAIAARSASGDVRVYPLVENRHRAGILRTSRAPAPGLTGGEQRQAAQAIAALLSEMNYVGVLAVEFFDRDGLLLANEMAPRVHNSGHWTIDAAATSQFENHLRAGLELPLGGTDALGCSLMVNIIGVEPPRDAVIAHPGARLHLYDKRPAPGRKLGHITLRGADWPSVEASAASLLARLAERGWSDQSASGG